MKTKLYKALFERPSLWTGGIIAFTLAMAYAQLSHADVAMVWHDGGTIFFWWITFATTVAGARVIAQRKIEYDRCEAENKRWFFMSSNGTQQSPQSAAAISRDLEGHLMQAFGRLLFTCLAFGLVFAAACLVHVMPLSSDLGNLKQLELATEGMAFLGLWLLYQIDWAVD